MATTTVYGTSDAPSSSNSNYSGVPFTREYQRQNPGAAQANKQQASADWMRLGLTSSGPTWSTVAQQPQRGGAITNYRVAPDFGGIVVRDPRQGGPGIMPGALTGYNAPGQLRFDLGRFLSPSTGTYGFLTNDEWRKWLGGGAWEQSQLLPASLPPLTPGAPFGPGFNERPDFSYYTAQGLPIGNAFALLQGQEATRIRSLSMRLIQAREPGYSGLAWNRVPVTLDVLGNKIESLYGVPTPFRSDFDRGLYLDRAQAARAGIADPYPAAEDYRPASSDVDVVLPWGGVLRGDESMRSKPQPAKSVDLSGPGGFFRIWAAGFPNIPGTGSWQQDTRSEVKSRFDAARNRGGGDATKGFIGSVLYPETNAQAQLNLGLDLVSFGFGSFVGKGAGVAARYGDEAVDLGRFVGRGSGRAAEAAADAARFGDDFADVSVTTRRFFTPTIAGSAMTATGLGLLTAGSFGGGWTPLPVAKPDRIAASFQSTPDYSTPVWWDQAGVKTVADTGGSPQAPAPASAPGANPGWVNQGGPGAFNFPSGGGIPASVVVGGIGALVLGFALASSGKNQKARKSTKK